jgi:hypothetical protein
MGKLTKDGARAPVIVDAMIYGSTTPVWTPADMRGFVNTVEDNYIIHVSGKLKPTDTKLARFVLHMDRAEMLDLVSTWLKAEANQAITVKRKRKAAAEVVA